MFGLSGFRLFGMLSVSAREIVHLSWPLPITLSNRDATMPAGTLVSAQASPFH